jgi:hypothetical protein
VIETIAKRESGCHANDHSIPPTHPEALEGKALAEAWIGCFARHPESRRPGDLWTRPHQLLFPGQLLDQASLIAMAARGIKVPRPVRNAFHPFTAPS